MNMGSFEIHTRAHECLGQFKLLIEIKEEIWPINEAAGNSYDVSWIEDQFARFKMWAGNIGAFAEGHASLDYRLRDSEETKQFMLEFLVSLKDFVHGAIETLRPGSSVVVTTRTDSLIEGSGLDDNDTSEPSTSAVSSAFQGTETESVLDEILPATTFERRLQGLERAIDRLYRLSLIIRQPSRSSQNEKAERFIMTDDDGNDIDKSFADFARHLVDHRFPTAPDFLRSKLSHGIVIRRKRFLYRQSHQRKLSGATSMKEEEIQNKPKANKDDEAESTVRGFNLVDGLPLRAASAPEHPMQTAPAPSQTSASAIAKQPLPLQTALEDVQSDHSTLFTAIHSLNAPVEIPAAPKPAAGSKEFECPYCCLVLPIKQSKALRWRRHVLEDLEPYTCVFEDCAADPALFQDRATWMSHLQAHRTRWVCSSAAHKAASFPNEEKYCNHMRTEHPRAFTESQLPLLAKRSKVPTPMTFQQCPLCFYVPGENELQQQPEVSQVQKEKLVSDRIMKHLASHLESFAVRALPWQDATEDGPEDQSQTGKADDITADSEGGSRVKSCSDSSLHFPEELEDDISIAELPAPSDELISPPIDSSYEQDWGFIKRPPYFGHDRDETLQPLLQRLFLADIAPSAVSGPVLPAYIVPVSRDKKFFGRNHVLNAIQQTLCKSSDESSVENKPLSFPRCYAVYGPGGMGKTQVAANFVSQHRHDFEAVLWVHAEDAEKIAQDYKEIAVRLGLVAADSLDSMDLDYTKDIVKRWLVNPRKDQLHQGEKKADLASWLLVFDGVEDGQVLNEFWPYNGPGSILITSRNPYSWSASLELKPFSVHEATQYLFHLTEQEPTPVETEAATAIATRLGGLPLALSQMGGIVAYQNYSFAQFLHLFEQHEGSQTFLDWRLFGTDRSLSNYENNVASVWAFDRLEKGTPLINILSMLDPDAIPESLFTTPVREKNSKLVRLLKEDYIDIRTELLARSLITGNKKEKKLFVHKLVQDVARTRMRQSDIRNNFMACVELINERWPFQELTWRHGVARWEDCEELFPHVQRLKAMFPSITPSPDSFEDYEFARLLIDSGWYQHERGKSPEGILSNNMAQSICESLKLRILEKPDLAKNSSVTLAQLNYSLVEITHNRGCIALEINEPSDALKYHRLFNEIMVRESSDSGPEDMRLAISWNELGNAHMLNRNWKKGEECFLKSIEEMRKYAQFKPTTISLPLANLGLAYWLQDKHTLASHTLLRGLQDRENEYGPGDRVSFITGRLLHALGNVESSLDYHRRALLHYKSTLGNRHHRTADVFVKVAEHHIKLGNHEMALALLDHSLDAFSISHTYMPEKTRAGWMRYKALRELGRKEEAGNELANCFQVYGKLRGKGVGSGAGGIGGLEVKKRAEDLDDRDIDDLIVFWSK